MYPLMSHDYWYARIRVAIVNPSSAVRSRGLGEQNCSREKQIYELF